MYRALDAPTPKRPNAPTNRLDSIVLNTFDDVEFHVVVEDDFFFFQIVETEDDVGGWLISRFLDPGFDTDRAVVLHFALDVGMATAAGFHAGGKVVDQYRVIEQFVGTRRLWDEIDLNEIVIIRAGADRDFVHMRVAATQGVDVGDFVVRLDLVVLGTAERLIGVSTDDVPVVEIGVLRRCASKVALNAGQLVRTGVPAVGFIVSGVFAIAIYVVVICPFTICIFDAGVAGIAVGVVGVDEVVVGGVTETAGQCSFWKQSSSSSQGTPSGPEHPMVVTVRQIRAQATRRSEK